MVAQRLLPDAAGLQHAAALLAAGEVVAFPTDTVYGVGCRWDDDAALDRLFALKRRPRERRVPILVHGLDDAVDLELVVDQRATCLASRFWPGPLTVVLPASAPGAETLAVRAPDHAVALALLRLTGPLRVTSANVSGFPEAIRADEVLKEFATSDLLAAVVDGGESPGGTASSIVDLSVDPPRLLRAGPVSAEALAGCIGPVATDARR
ncbi:MAG: L-threonylcarbamoyladenylate synthase [Candidatus Limnocylindria bacterium]